MNMIQNPVRITGPAQTGGGRTGAQTLTGMEDAFRSLLGEALQQDTPAGDTTLMESGGADTGTSSAPASSAGKEEAPKAEEEADGTDTVAASGAAQASPIPELLSGMLDEEMLQEDGLTTAQALEQLTDIADQEIPLAMDGLTDLTAQEPDAALPEVPLEDVLSMETVLPDQEATVEQPDLSVIPNLQMETEETLSQAQDRFDSMLSNAADKLAAAASDAEDGDVAEVVQKVELPEEIRMKPLEEPIEKQELPEVVRVMEKNVKSTVEIREKPEETVLNMAGQTTAPQEPVQQTAAQPLQAQQPESAWAPTPSEQIETEIIENLEQQKMEFRMQLQPQELGKVDVRIVLESGKLAVQVIAAEAKTAELLSRQMEGLAASLRVAGINLQSIQVVNAAENDNRHMEQSLDLMSGQSRESEQEEQDQDGRRGNGELPEDQAVSAAHGPEEEEPEALLDYRI